MVFSKSVKLTVKFSRPKRVHKSNVLEQVVTISQLLTIIRLTNIPISIITTVYWRDLHLYGQLESRYNRSKLQESSATKEHFIFVFILMYHGSVYQILIFKFQKHKVAIILALLERC